MASTGEYGDLIVFIEIEPHPYFERQGNNLYCAINISIEQAALGCKLNIPTLDNKTISLDVPAGTQHGQLLSIAGAGIKTKNAVSGNMYVRVQLIVPKRLSAKERQLLADFAQLNKATENPTLVALKDLNK